MAIKTKQFSLAEKIDFWKNHLSYWKQSKLSQAEYCRQNNLNKCLFSKWKIKLFNEKENKPFIEIPIENFTKESSKNGIELVINDSIKVMLDKNYNEELLIKLLKTMGVIG